MSSPPKKPKSEPSVAGSSHLRSCASASESPAASRATCMCEKTSASTAGTTTVTIRGSVVEVSTSQSVSAARSEGSTSANACASPCTSSSAVPTKAVSRTAESTRRRPTLAKTPSLTLSGIRPSSIRGQREMAASREPDATLTSAMLTTTVETSSSCVCTSDVIASAMWVMSAQSPGNTSYPGGEITGRSLWLSMFTTACVAT
mmetsp:Transcript_14131/g.35895  ORF Transcript_14131/g.35895 Transcript_14131/m.35895 type:complete len:203 (-) Transcript_14131:146-754(-)